MNGKIKASLGRQFRENFEQNCIEGIWLGYQRMIAERRYETYWVEDKITEHLVANMEECGFLISHGIIIEQQRPIHNEDVTFGSGDPAKSPVIDLKFGVAWNSKEYRYYVEAKILSEQNWVKPGKKLPVRPDKQIKRYIQTGIEHYLTSYYPQGCLLGYVVNGSVENVVSAINHRIDELSSNARIGRIVEDVSASQAFCFYSENALTHSMLTLRHLILQLA